VLVSSLRQSGEIFNANVTGLGAQINSYRHAVAGNHIPCNGEVQQISNAFPLHRNPNHGSPRPTEFFDYLVSCQPDARLAVNFYDDISGTNA
jgi:hypothetical protein